MSFELNSEQQEKLEEMKGLIASNNVEMKKDADILRFLIGYQWKTDKAFEMYKAEREWFKETRPDLIRADDVRSEIEHGKFYFLDRGGVDRNGNLIAFIDATKHNKKESPPEKVIPLMEFFMEECIRRMTSDTQKVSVIIYMKDLKWSRFYDGKTFRQAAKVMNDNYCERLADAYLVSAPGLFKAMWNIVKPFIDPSTRKKIHVTSKKNLSKYIDPVYLPKFMHGTHEDFSEETWARDIGLSVQK